MILHNLRRKEEANIKELPLKQPSYFYPIPEEKMNYVSSYISHMAPGYLYLLKQDSFKPINHVSSEPFYTFGVVMSPTGCKIEKECFVINTEDGSNTLVRLNLAGVDGYTLVSGQAVALKTRNPAGNELVVEKLYSHSILKKSTQPRRQLNFLLLNGPLTREQLERRAEQAAGGDCDALIILGPFTPLGAAISDGFKLMLSFIQDITSKHTDLSIICVPSLEDCGALKVIPQPAARAECNRLFVGSNPSSFSINDHLVSIMNYDALSKLHKEELYSKSSIPESILVPHDPFARVADLLVFRRSYIPAFPFSLPIVYGSWSHIDISPDIMIVRSELPRFVRVTGGTLVINIGNIPGEGYVVKSTKANEECSEYLASELDS